MRGREGIHLSSMGSQHRATLRTQGIDHAHFVEQVQVPSTGGSPFAIFGCPAAALTSLAATHQVAQSLLRLGGAAVMHMRSGTFQIQQWLAEPARMPQLLHVCHRHRTMFSSSGTHLLSSRRALAAPASPGLHMQQVAESLLWLVLTFRHTRSLDHAQQYLRLMSVAVQHTFGEIATQALQPLRRPACTCTRWQSHSSGWP